MLGYLSIASAAAVAAFTHVLIVQSDINGPLLGGLSVLSVYGLLQAINWSAHVPFDGKPNDALSQHWIAGGLHLILGCMLLISTNTNNSQLLVALWTVISVIAFCRGIKRIGYAVATIVQVTRQRRKAASEQKENARIEKAIEDDLEATACKAKEAEEDTQALLDDLNSIFSGKMD